AATSVGLSLVPLLPSPPPARSALFPYTTLFRSHAVVQDVREPDPAFPIRQQRVVGTETQVVRAGGFAIHGPHRPGLPAARLHIRSEEHTSELQSRENLVCRLLLEKKKRTDAAGA